MKMIIKKKNRRRLSEKEAAAYFIMEGLIEKGDEAC